MAKFVFLLFAALAIHAVAAHSDKSKKFKEEFTSVRRDVLASIDNIRLTDAEKIRFVASRANDFAYKLEEAIHRMYKLMLLTEEEKVNRVLPQTTTKLNEIVHTVQETIISRQNQLKAVLKDSVQQVFTKLEEVIDLLAYLEGKPNQDKPKDKLEDVIDKMFKAVRYLEVNEELHRQPLFRINVNTSTSTSSMAKEIVEMLNSITWYDQGVAHRLTNQGYELSHFLRHIIHHFERESFHFKGEDKQILDDILVKLRDILSSLEQVVQNHDFRNVQYKVNQLKSQLSLAVQGYATQIDRLQGIMKSEDKDSDYLRGYEHLIKDVIYDCYNKTRHMRQVIAGIARQHRHY